MSENPNPTVCGNCGTENPPGQEYCLTCHVPLTLTAGAAGLEQTPEAADEPRRYEPEGQDQDDTPEVVRGGMGGAPIPVPVERLDPDPGEPPRH